MPSNKTKLTAKIIAPVAALIVLFICFLVPMYIFRVLNGIPLDAKGSESEIWFLVIGGGLGAGGAYYTYYAVLTKLGGFNQREVDALWHGKNKNT